MQLIFSDPDSDVIRCRFGPNLKCFDWHLGYFDLRTAHCSNPFLRATRLWRAAVIARSGSAMTLRSLSCRCLSISSHQYPFKPCDPLSKTFDITGPMATRARIAHFALSDVDVCRGWTAKTLKRSSVYMFKGPGRKPAARLADACQSAPVERIVIQQFNGLGRLYVVTTEIRRRQ